MRKYAEDFSPEWLRNIRKERGLTQVQLAAMCMIPRNAVVRFETGLQVPTVPVWSKILRILHTPGQDDDPQVTALNPSFTFTPGRHYSIRSTERTNCRLGEWNLDVVSVFEYIGKQGIHHCFREIHGGWSRTYTDAQLIGKHIEEVSL